MTYRAWNTKTVDRAALKELTAAIAQQNTEELEYQNMDEEWSEEKYRSVLAAQQKEAGLLAGILAARGITDPAEALTLLAGAGPGIAVQILPVGSVQAAFSTDFTTAGINQTRHRISLVLTANVQIVIPTGAKNVQASTQMAMAESIIVGQVPDSFAEGGSDNSIIDLAP